MTTETALHTDFGELRPIVDFRPRENTRLVVSTSRVLYSVDRHGYCTPIGTVPSRISLTDHAALASMASC